MQGYNYFKYNGNRVSIASKRLYKKLDTLNGYIAKLPSDGLEIHGTLYDPQEMLTYNRIFNDMHGITGGRIYNRLTSMDKETRKTFRFNGQPTIELDLQCAMPRMLYHLRCCNERRDIYSLDLSKNTRDVNKLALNIALNSPSEDIAIHALNNTIGHYIKSKAIIRTLPKIYAPIARYFYSGIGLKLQVFESDIAIKVLTELAKMDIVSTGIHDAFIVPNNKPTIEFTKELIIKNYKEVLGVFFDPVISIKNIGG